MSYKSSNDILEELPILTQEQIQETSNDFLLTKYTYQIKQLKLINVAIGALILKIFKGLEYYKWNEELNQVVMRSDKWICPEKNITWEESQSVHLVGFTIIKIEFEQLQELLNTYHYLIIYKAIQFLLEHIKTGPTMTELFNKRDNYILLQTHQINTFFGL